MDHVSLLVVDGAEWEEIIVYTTLETALEKSRAWPNTRVEIFSKSEKGGYRPTYNYYLNGSLVQTNMPTE